MSLGMKCQNCGKGSMYGHKVSHAKNRTKRTFDPNLHVARVVINGISKRAKLCAKCLRKIKRDAIKKATPKVESPIAATV